MSDPLIGGNSAQVLRSYIERIERLDEEKRAIQADIAEIYKEAKSAGFDPKIMRKIVAERRRPTAEVEEEQALIDTYKVNLGMLRDTPLGDAAMRAAKKDHGRAAPHAAGDVAGGDPTPPASDVASRPVANPALPDPDDEPPEHRAITGMREAVACARGGMQPARVTTFALPDDPLEIPPFLDRRAKAETAA